jgi:hypothetical protein
MLPTLTTATHELTLPSSGKTISFRPYLVKEEKILLQALETGNQKEIIKTVIKLIDTCVLDDIDTSKFTLYDFEYVFLQIRTKSMGDTAEVNFKCTGTDCNEVHGLDIDLSKLKFEYPAGDKLDNKVMLNDTVGVQLQHIPCTIMTELGDNFDPQKLDAATVEKLLISAIVSIFDQESVWPVETLPKSELVNFIDSMTAGQLAGIQKYISNQPAMIYRSLWTCPKCGKENKIILKGLESFLG